MALALLLACGSGANDVTGAGDASDATAADAPLPDDAEAEAGPYGPCPDAIPTAGAECSSPGLWCEYGGGDHGRCSTRALCAKAQGSQGQILWTLFAPDTPCAPNAAACPPDLGIPPGADCPLADSCDYAAGRCACSECTLADGGRLQQWFCRPWGDVGAFLDDGGATDAGGGCPADRPRLGTDCVDQGFVCGYDACYGVSLGPYLRCANGRWGVGPQTDLCNRPACR